MQTPRQRYDRNRTGLRHQDMLALRMMQMQLKVWSYSNNDYLENYREHNQILLRTRSSNLQLLQSYKALAVSFQTGPITARVNHRSASSSLTYCVATPPLHWLDMKPMVKTPANWHITSPPFVPWQTRIATSVGARTLAGSLLGLHTLKDDEKLIRQR